MSRHFFKFLSLAAAATALLLPAGQVLAQAAKPAI